MYFLREEGWVIERPLRVRNPGRMNNNNVVQFFEFLSPSLFPDINAGCIILKTSVFVLGSSLTLLLPTNVTCYTFVHTSV